MASRHEAPPPEETARWPHSGHIVETGNESIRFSRSTAEAKKHIRAQERTRKGSKPETEAQPF